MAGWRDDPISEEAPAQGGWRDDPVVEGERLRAAEAGRRPPDNRPRRTDPATGETRVWNGSAWVKE